MAEKTAAELEAERLAEEEARKISEGENGAPPKDAPTGGQELTVEELKAKLASTEKGMTEQIKDLRKKLHEAEIAKVVPPKNDSLPNETEVEKTVRAILDKEKQANAEKNRIEALRLFWENHKDFHPDNDLTGLKNEALKTSLKRINTAGNYATEDILNDLEAAYGLMSIVKSPSPKSNLNSGASMPIGGGQPQGAATTKLTPEQEALRKTKGWTEEKYLKMKAKYPNVVL